MKMYYLTPGGYCNEYHVMAEDREQALNFLKAYCLEEDKAFLREQLQYYGSRKEYVFPNKITWPNDSVVTMETEQEGLDKVGSYMKDYRDIVARKEEGISEYSQGQVVQTEVC